MVWELPVDGSGDLIKSGSKLYAAGKDAITVIALPDEARPARVVTRIPTDGDVVRLVAGGDTLLAVTLDADEDLDAFALTAVREFPLPKSLS